MRGRRWGPRLGLGSSRIDAERARFTAAADVLQYFIDLHCLTQEQLGQRCGVRREQMTRWLTGAREPTLSKLAELLEPLGWKPMIVLERTEAAVEELLTEPGRIEDLLDHDVRAIIATVVAAVDQGLDVVVGGEAAAVLQGVPVPTRHLTLHVRPEHVGPFVRLVGARWLDVARLAGGWMVRHGPVSVDVLPAPVRPPTRIVTVSELGSVAVVDLEELLVGTHGVGPSVRRVSGG